MEAARAVTANVIVSRRVRLILDISDTFLNSFRRMKFSAVTFAGREELRAPDFISSLIRSTQ